MKTLSSARLTAVAVLATGAAALGAGPALAASGHAAQAKKKRCDPKAKRHDRRYCGGGGGASSGAIPRKLTLVYTHADAVDHTEPTSDVFGHYANITHQALKLTAQIPLTLSRSGSAQVSGPIRYTQAEYNHEVSSTDAVAGTDRSKSCPFVQTFKLVSTQGSSAQADLVVGRASGRSLPAITLSFDPGHATERTQYVDTPSAGSYCPGYQSTNADAGLFRSTFQGFYQYTDTTTRPRPWDYAKNAAVIANWKRGRGKTVATAVKSGPFPYRTDGSYSDTYQLVAR